MKILLDLDGVLNRFTYWALLQNGVPEKKADHWNPEWGFDCMPAIRHYFPNRTAKEFWGCLDRRFWRTIPKSNLCNWLVSRTAEIVGRENVCILTSPILDPDCLAGKVEWIEKNLPKWLHRQYLIGPVKHFCAGTEDHLLIDDSTKNVTTFVEHGGLAILVPRPWNHYQGIDTFNHVGTELAMLEKELD